MPDAPKTPPPTAPEKPKATKTPSTTTPAKPAPAAEKESYEVDPAQFYRGAKQLDADFYVREAVEHHAKANAKAPKPGRLRSTTVWTIHTAHAQRLFQGRSRSRKDKIPAIHGVFVFAGATYQLSQISSWDNPAADWVLICVEESLEELRSNLEERTRRLQKVLKKYRDRGMAISIVQSEEPLQIENTSFGTPYGYQGCVLMVAFDMYVRLLLTLEQIGELTHRHATDMREEVAHAFRRLFTQTREAANLLNQMAENDLLRSDFGDSPRDNMKQRIERIEPIVRVYGPIPQAVIDGQRPVFVRPIIQPPALFTDPKEKPPFEVK